MTHNPVSASIVDLNNYLDSILSKVQEVKDQINEELEEKLEEIRKEQEELDALSNKMRQVSPKVKSIVKFNVGGQKFATTKENLLSETTFFTALLSENFDAERDEEGAVFLDKDPKHFGKILNYFRDKKFHTERLSEEEKNEVLEEAKFYQIHSLIRLIKPSIQIPSLQFSTDFVTQRITLSNNNTSLTVIDDEHWSCSMICTNTAKHWKVVISRIDGSSDSGGLMIGVAPKEFMRKQGLNFEKTGYFLNSNGYLCGPTLKGKEYAPALKKTGCIVDCIYRNGTLSFKVDGKDLGVACTNLPENMIPAFDFFHGCTLSIEQIE